jgi:DNA invertase Pin-like site-specific DNA recombinase
MPPQRSDKKKKLIEQEGRLLLAMQAIKNGKYPSAAAIARSFEISVSTLKARINRRESAAEKRPSGHIFT